MPFGHTQTGTNVARVDAKATMKAKLTVLIGAEKCLLAQTTISTCNPKPYLLLALRIDTS